MKAALPTDDIPRPTALIAEDEPLLAEALKAELTGLWPELEIVAVVGNGRLALEASLALEPDVAFIDIRMPSLSGIEVAQALVEDWQGRRPPPLPVFVTAYDQFAVDAFQHAAIDYLLKPVETARLALTVTRLRDRLAERGVGRRLADAAPLDELAARLRVLLSLDPGSAQPEPALRIIRAGVGETVRLIPVDQVVYLQAADKYVNVVTADGEALIRESLRELLPRLDADRFVQIHRSTVVNLDHVRAAVRDDSGRVLLDLNGRPERLLVSRLYSPLFKAM